MFWIDARLQHFQLSLRFALWEIVHIIILWCDFQKPFSCNMDKQIINNFIKLKKKKYFFRIAFLCDFWKIVKLAYVLHLSQFVYSFSLWARIHCIWPNPVCDLSTLTDEAVPLGYLWSSNNVPFVLNEPPRNWWNDFNGKFVRSSKQKKKN